MKFSLLYIWWLKVVASWGGYLSHPPESCLHTSVCGCEFDAITLHGRDPAVTYLQRMRRRHGEPWLSVLSAIVGASRASDTVRDEERDDGRRTKDGQRSMIRSEAPPVVLSALDAGKGVAW